MLVRNLKIEFFPRADSFYIASVFIEEFSRVDCTIKNICAKSKNQQTER